MEFYLYASDTQMYIYTKPSTSFPPSALTSCLKDIKTWMSNNFLKLNGNKSEVLLLVQNLHSLKQRCPTTISIDDYPVQISSQVKSLGVILDSTLSFIPQINNIFLAAFFHIRNISRLCSSLSQHGTQTLIHTLVTSHIHYCNVILSALPNKLLHWLQIIQDSAARIIKTKSSDHITLTLIPHPDFLFNNRLITNFYC
ncbi:hypothetical protein LDENG_00105020 [Lucifuga dentata]|nr:hypothetical protein LDENG_00105020 [Lucifuga dentata]